MRCGQMVQIAVQDDSIDFKAVLTRFVALNEARLRRTYGALRPRQAEFLHLLPLLFHVNHPALPGYISKETPAGISGYEPDDDAREAASRQGRSFRYDPERERRLRAIYCMGSAGSVAYSGESDFDLWLCHDPALDENALTLLAEKAESIRQWAESLELEVHFFLVNPHKYRCGEIERLGGESCGSAQYRLLLDEFYRTGLHLAGMYPMWWLVPPEREADYDQHVAALKRQRFVYAKNLLDLGGMANFPAEEFLGAAIWQLSKGIDSPYKSVLKLLLIEAYAREYPQLDLLSLQFKRAVYRGDSDVDRLDPYLMMLDRVESYLQARGERARLELARRCFYLKVDENLTTEGPVAQWRRSLLEARVRGWGWSRAELQQMDGRESWKVHRVAEERRILFDALSASYRFLSDFARRHAGSALITREDLTVLGRKLYAAFERKAGKIELVSRGITESLVESHLALHEELDEQQRSVWVLYRGNPRPEEADRETALKRTQTIAKMVAWCYFNRVLDRGTVLTVYGRESRFDTRQFRAMVARMYELFPAAAGEGGSMADFASPARMRRCVAFVNTGQDPLVCGELPHGSLAGDRADVLSYGGMQENLVRCIDLVVTTSWREVLTFHYAGSRGLLDCLCEFLKWNAAGHAEVPAQTSVTSTSPAKAAAIARRVQDLLGDLVDRFHGAETAVETRYILRVGRAYYALYLEEEQPKYDHIGAYDALLHYLGGSHPVFRQVVFDRNALDDPLLALIYQNNRPGVVQFFYRVTGGELEFFVLDERGSLFCRRMGHYDVDALLSHYARFFDAVLNRMNFLMQEGQPLQAPEEVEFYAVRRGAEELRLERQPQVEAADGSYLSLQVIMDVDDDGNTTFTLYCDGREFSSLEMGNRVFEAAVNHVLELRQSGQRYPVYITDVSMSPTVVGQDALGKIQTVNFLAYKARVEEKLDRALTRTQT